MREQRVSIARLSEATGISARLIARYRAGEVVPRDHWGDPTDNAIAIAAELNLTVDEMFGGDADEPRSDDGGSAA